MQSQLLGDSGNSNSVDKEKELLDNLQEWVVTTNVTVSSVNKILKIFKPYVDFLPLDYRTLMKSPRVTKTMKLRNGECIILELKTIFYKALEPSRF